MIFGKEHLHELLQRPGNDYGHMGDVEEYRQGDLDEVDQMLGILRPWMISTSSCS